VIIDLKRFIEAERPFWTELESILAKLEADPGYKLQLDQIKRFHYLYERTSGGLAKLMTFAVAPETRNYLENLVARAYGEVHETRERPHRFTLLHWFFLVFPQTFRRHIRPFWLSCAAMFFGSILGAAILALDPESKHVVLPFEHLLGDPAERVAKEEAGADAEGPGAKHAYFSSTLMTHNTRVAITTLSLGMTYGVGTLISLFYNGVILGAVAWDYILAGQTMFLLGWLLPHGAIEIPAIVVAGQAGLLLASALIGWGKRATLRERLKIISNDLLTLIGGVACLLIWAGLVEAFLSQYHAPVLPYWIKILFGAIELLLLVAFLTRSGRQPAAA
jgi:uncharacterized membrane protein SpoIIM required for sporulation